MNNPNDIRSVESEAGIIATIINKPEYTFHSEELKPNHFSDQQNAYLYYAIVELARKGIDHIDSYNVTNFLNSKESTKKQTDTLTIPALNELIDLSKLIARESIEEYRLLVKIVMNKAFRRDTYSKLKQCENLCFTDNEDEIQQQIYNTLDGVMMEFSTTNEVPEYKDVIEDIWKDIVERQKDGFAGIPFKYPTLNNYCTIEPGELIIVGANTKVGKSIYLLSCAADLMKKDIPTLYIDSELNTRMFTTRLIAHLSHIEYSRVKFGKYSPEEKERIDKWIAWLKTRKFTHLYVPLFDAQTIYTAAKKVKHTQGLETIIVDYFKSKGNEDSFSTYQEMGKLVDMVKNQICGDMNIAGIGAAQATATGKIADSAKISRNASTILLLERKTPEEIERDGIPDANTKLKVVLNRNGGQHSDNEYIDLNFNGNLCSYEETKQHVVVEPY